MQGLGPPERETGTHTQGGRREQNQPEELQKPLSQTLRADPLAPLLVTGSMPVLLVPVRGIIPGVLCDNLLVVLTQCNNSNTKTMELFFWMIYASVDFTQ